MELSLNLKGQLIALNRPHIMAIVNLTPDSFYDGGRYQGETQFVQRVEQCISEGADWLDLGAQSTRPGAQEIGAAAEWKMLAPRLKWLQEHMPHVPVSVDTYHAEVAARAIDAGAALINDIGGGTLDSEMFNTIARYRVPYILMHTPAHPSQMQNHTQYTDVVGEVVSHLAKQRRKLLDLGVNDIILDPGFGFGKTMEQNFQLFQSLPELLHLFENPILVGISRKSMVYKASGITPDQGLPGTLALHTLAAWQGAHILRVHDVAETVQVLKMVSYVQNPGHARS